MFTPTRSTHPAPEAAPPHSARPERHDAARPRLAVFRSLEHIYGQIIDDTAGNTLVAASDLEATLRERRRRRPRATARKQVGQLLAERAKEKGITAVVFDRGGFLYHGRIKALADGAREGGLDF